MAEWRDGEVRYLVRFDDGGAGMRTFAKPVTVGDPISDGGCEYVVSAIEPPKSMQGFGHIEAQRAEGKLRRDR